MPSLEMLLLFVPVALLLNLTPGPDMLFCLGTGMRSGPRAGVAAATGVVTGSFLHAVAAGLGLAAIMATNPIAFEIVRWAGIAYLVWIAIDGLRRPLDRPDETATPRGNGGLLRAYRSGILVCLLNPKVAIFVLALLPQFVEPDRGAVLGQFLVLGAILSAGGLLVNGLVGGFAGGIGRALARRESVARAVQLLTSCLFLALAARLAFEKR